MNNRSWTMVLLSLVVLLVGCGTPDVESQQPEQALHATQAASREILAPTTASSPTAGEPAPTATLQPTAEEPAPTDTLLPTADEPTSTSTPLPSAMPTVEPPTVAPSATPAAVLTSKDVQRLAPAEAKELLDRGLAVLYDARSAGEYRTQHAAGALSYPASDMAARYGELPIDKSLVFY